MTSKKPVSSATDVAVLTNRLLATIAFLEQAQEFPSGKPFRKLVNDAAGRGDIRALRLMCKEVEGMVVALTQPQRKALDDLLEEFGVDRDAERKKTRSEIETILKRGTIASERERRRLEDYLAILETAGGDETTIERIRDLLGTS